MLTQEKLRFLLNYDDVTGIFIWLRAKKKNFNSNEAGYKNAKGYIKIKIEGVLYGAHRLAWLYVHGAWPVGMIDHKDHNPSNNKITNLRDVTHAENNQNRNRANKNNVTTKVLNVSFHKGRGKYVVHIHLCGKLKHFGYFSTLKIAEGVARRARLKYRVQT